MGWTAWTHGSAAAPSGAITSGTESLSTTPANPPTPDDDGASTFSALSPQVQTAQLDTPAYVPDPDDQPDPDFIYSNSDDLNAPDGTVADAQLLSAVDQAFADWL
jgi:hypothetical protein